MYSPSDFKYNFTIFKAVFFLYKIKAISFETYSHHRQVMDDGRAAGLIVDYDRFTVEGAPGETYKF